MSLVKQCEEILERIMSNKQLVDSAQLVDIFYPSWLQCSKTFPFGLPIDRERLERFFSTGEYSDLDIYVGVHDTVLRSHKVILGSWSTPFTKVINIVNSFSLTNLPSLLPLVGSSTSKSTSKKYVFSVLNPVKIFCYFLFSYNILVLPLLSGVRF